MTSTWQRHSHFLAHSSDVNCLRFGRKSGQVMATGGEDHAVNLWRLREKETKSIMSLTGHQSSIESITFDPSERRLVAGASSGSIKAFDLETGKVSRTLKGHMASCTALDYHLYGDYVASGALDTIVKVWDLKSKGCMQTFKGHKSEVTTALFTPDGRWLTSGDSNGVIRIWDLTAGKLLKEFHDHSGPITNLEFNPEEFILVSASADKTVRFYDVQEMSLIGITPIDNSVTTTMCHSVSEPYSGQYLFAFSSEAMRVWSYETAIQCHGSLSSPRVKEYGAVEAHVDCIMTDDLQIVGGSIQDAFVSIWTVDANQVPPFQRSVPSTSVSVCRPNSSTQHSRPSSSAQRSRPSSSRPNSSAQSSRPNSSRPMSSSEGRISSMKTQAEESEDNISADFMVELRSGMETSIQTLSARKKTVTQLLERWQRGQLHDGLRFLAALPSGKREAVTSDVFRHAELKTLGIDLEGCVLVLPLLIELVASRFGRYNEVGVHSSKELFDAFAPIIKDSRMASGFTGREVDFASEERMKRCQACDTCFQQLKDELSMLSRRNSDARLQQQVLELGGQLETFCP